MPRLVFFPRTISQGRRKVIDDGDGTGQTPSHVLKERGFDPLVLVDTTNSGAVPIDKFVRSAAKCAFAIALFTPDDFVGAGKAGIRQARPNVLFELGWFYGRFGPSRTPIVKQTKTAIPSDLAGILSRDFIENVSEVMDGVAN